jgi:alkanesulfonate monooxygenase SsuD/methylene tetrahydromethanopterin reductase-like flavin-dependent oxidoreductase (luciferase family)
MKIGVSFPGVETTYNLMDWARRVDAGPYSSLSLNDRLVYHNNEPLITLAMAAAVTTHVRLFTEILLLPLRNTGIVAKQCATLDALSGGRLTLGLGVGNKKDDFLAANIDFHTRGKRMDQQLAELKHIWSGQPISQEVGSIGPSPIQPGGPEIIFGGWSPVSFRRLLQYGAGFVNSDASVTHANNMFRQVEAGWQQAGRTGKPRLIGQVHMALETADITAATSAIRNYYHVLGLSEQKAAGLITTRAQARDTIKAYADIGTDELVFFCWSADLDQLDRLAEVI